MGRKKLNSDNVLTRVDESFNEELEEIKDERVKNDLDEKRISTRELTELITKHNSWPIIKKDLLKIKLEKNDNE